MPRVTRSPVVPSRIRLSGRATRAVARRSTGQQITPSVDIGGIWGRFPGFKPNPLKFSVRRPQDLLSFDLYPVNLKVAADGARLVRIDPGKTAILVLQLPPQHFGEQAWLDKTGPDVSASTVAGMPETTDDPAINDKNTTTASAEPIGPLPAARMRMAGPSRLAFTMPEEESSLALTFDAVLQACLTWPLRLSALAQPDPPQRHEAQDLGWLLDVTNSAAFDQAITTLSDALTGLAPRSVLRAVSTAAGRLAGSMKHHTNRGSAAQARSHVTRAMSSEIAALQRRYSGLRGESHRELLLAYTAALATREYARINPRYVAEKLSRFPDILLLLKPHQPPDTVTALELPYRLITTPILPAQWRHAPLPVTHQGRTELWHTRLSASDNKPADSGTRIRAIWSPDYLLPDMVNIVNQTLPFRMSLDPLDREMLVKLMAGFNERVSRSVMYRPRSGAADRLILSPLGALLDAEGNWNPQVNPMGVDLEQWRHLASIGRDQYVRVVYRGFLYPFGHSASLIKVTERKFEDHDGPTRRVAVLRQRFFIVVREPLRHYAGSGHQFDGRNFPFSSVEILTRVTPSLLAPEKPGSKPSPDNNVFNSIVHRECFWPSLSASNRFQFELRFTDIEGDTSSFAMPLLFVGMEANGSHASAIRTVYNLADTGRRSGDAGGQSIAFAPVPAVTVEGGDPRLPARNITFAAANNTAAGNREARTYPELERADVAVAAAQRMLGKADATLSVQYFPAYKSGGFGGANPGEVFLEAAGAALGLDFKNDLKSDSVGALAAPSMQIAGLSRLLGPAGDIANVAADSFDPAQFFDGAELLGGIKISDIIGVVTALTNTEAPQMLTRELPERIEASFEWETKITDSDPLGLLVPGAGGDTILSIHSLTSSPINQPDAATVETHASLVHFKVNLFDFITIWFERLQFDASSGSKPEVLVDLDPDEAVMFGGPLEFVNELKDIIPIDGFSDPPNLDITPSGLSASYSLGLPDLQVGILALTNISIGAGFSLPFDSRPVSVTFNFCERQSPFSLTVSMFGGGGFFLIGVGSKGVQEIEAALEFGAGVAINLGVASGSVEVKAGIYFHWLSDSVELAGYVRLHGELSVIGLISVSLTFNLQLAYLKEGQESVVWGEATLVVEVEVLVFSASVEVHCRREFAGSESDPRFIDLVPQPAIWDEYCGAFAQEAA